MADINQVISLGVGTPADIPHFILVGLSPNAAAGPAYGTDDLTTDVAFYLADTILPMSGHLNEDFRNYCDDVRGTTGENDLNTALWVDLNF